MRRLIKILFANKGWLLILLMGFVSLTWFKEDLLIAGGDDYVLLDPGAFTNFFRYAWNIKLPNAGGIVFSIPRLIPMLYFWTFFQSLGLSLVTIEKLWAVLLFVLPGLSMYYFMSQIYNKIWAKIIASTLYMFNLFLIVAGPFQGNIKPVLIALPLMLAFFIKGLSNKKESFLKYSVLIGLCSLLYAGSNVNLPTVAIVPFILFLYWLFHFVVERKEFFRTLKFVLATVGCYLFLNFWWIANFLADVIQKASVVREVATFSAVGTTGMVDFFRLLGVWAWRMGHYRMPYFPYAHFYDEPFLLLLSFSIPLLAFLAIFLKPKDKNVCFFSFLAVIGLFLAKGSAAPFGFLYKWMWENVPGFWIFREPFSKFTPITLLAYSVLLGFSVDLLYQKTSNWQARRKKGYQLFWPSLIPIITIVIIFIVAYPLLTGEAIWDKWNGSMRSFQVKVPQYWQEMKEYIINHNLQEERLLTFPASGYGMAYNWQHGFSSADDAAVALLPNPTIRNSSILLGETDLIASQLFDKLLDRDFNLKSYLSLLNTQYVLQENDADWRYSGGGMLPPSKSNRRLQESGLTKVTEFGKFTPDYLAKIPNNEPNRSLHDELYEELTNQPALILYKMDDQYFLPHFYIPQKLYYSDGGIEDLGDIVSFDDYRLMSGTYLDENGKWSMRNKNLLDRVDEIFIKARLAESIEDYLKKKESFKSKVPFPFVRHRPGSFFYSLVLIKEQLDEWLHKRDKEELLEKKLFYAGKRISELRKFNLEIADEALMRQVLELYLTKMEEAIELVNQVAVESDQNGEMKEEMAIRLRAYWESHREILEEIVDYIYQEEKKEKILELIGSVFGQLDEKLKPLEKSLDWQKLEYSFEIPIESRYELNIQTPSESELRNWKIELDGEKISLEEIEMKKGGWITLKEKHFKKGEHQIVLSLLESANLVGNNWQTIKGAEIKGESFQFSSKGFSPDAQSLLFQEINQWLPDNLYYLGFSYRAEKGSWGLGVLEEKIIYREEEKVIKKEKLFEKALKSVETEKLRSWKKYEVVMESDSDTLGARVYLYALPSPSQLAKVDLRNLVVVRLVRPKMGLKIVLRGIEPQTSSFIQSTPKITFTKINPTKYRIKVEGAKEPYTLIFSESFHEGWKAWITDGTEKSEGTEKIIISYFDGEIKEGTHKNIFLDRNTFETWGKKPIPEERHLLVNGYANSWYITPGDSDGKEDYEIIIEFWPQRLFYIGLFVSLITFLGCFGYLGVKTIRRYSEKRIFI